ncbi:hypothetical protein XA68_12840 [Ophiocordyceps unilateralis]|uniref:Uncharacterized protein n=1 Tax=Ophiocordyceps unilateralis TaxID=268505 RepID=A0A2A9PC17_OPHUN|nr:hypothetical protein XA68_12840 [Ophiocordyceps unilateralis]
MEGETPHDAATVEWLELQDPSLQESHAAALLDGLLEEARQPRSTSGQACVRLIALVAKSSKSSSDGLRCWALSESVVLRLFHFYLEWNETDRHRSVKLVLDLIDESVQSSPDQEAAARTKQHIVDNLISTVTNWSVKPAAKAAMTCLDHFLKSGTLTLGDIYSSYSAHRKEVARLAGCHVWKPFITDMFRWIRLHFVSLSAGRFVVTVYRFWRTGSAQAPQGPDVDTWFQWLVDFASNDPSLIEPIRNYILVPLFKGDRLEGLRFLNKVNKAVCSQDLNTILFQLATLESGKKAGLVECGSSEDERDQDGELSSLTICPSILDDLLAHSDERVRVLALSVLVTSPSTTAPYTIEALNILRKHLSSLFSEPNAKVREEASAKLRDMYRRLRGAVHVLKRSIPRAREKAHADGTGSASGTASQPNSHINLSPLSCLRHHEEFLTSYLAFLCDELVPTTSYQRHIASLKALNFILRMETEAKPTWGTEQAFLDSFDDKWARTIFDMLMDPFDDVRDEAAKALHRFYSDSRFRRFALDSSSVEGRRTVDNIAVVSRRAEELARRTSRADHSDGVSRAQQLLYRSLPSREEQTCFLEQKVRQLVLKVSRAERDLGRAVLDEPLHGDLASLSRLWQVAVELKLPESQGEVITALQSDLVSLCERLWNAVRDVLCFDSPEGHLPQGLEEIEGLETKSLLSFSFRAVNEASNLLRIIVLTARNRKRAGFVAPTGEVFGRIGSIAFDQLASLRHRGALTAVGLLFAAFCQQAKNMDTDLGRWYEEAMDLLFSFTSTTRRSAGLPTIITGILSAKADPPFEDVMDRLISIASKEVQVSETATLPQVHAYNCLRGIFKVSTNGRQWEMYLSPCLQLAAIGLRSDMWAIRNSGLMLLRSLVDCLFGSHESKAMIEAGWDGKANRLAYHRYPEIATVLRDLLSAGHETLESGISVLEIIRRGGPPELLRDEIEVQVQDYLASSVWQVRELAARTLCSCLLNQQWFPTVESLLEKAVEKGQANEVHGVLLTLKAIIQRLKDVAMEQLEAECPKLARLLAPCWIVSRFAYCPDVVAAYVDVLNTVWTAQTTNSGGLTPFISPDQGQGSDSSLEPGEHAGLAELYIDVCLEAHTSEVYCEALQNLATCLDDLLKRGKADSISFIKSLKRLWSRLCSRPIGPAVSNQVLKLSGVMTVLNGSSDLRAWGRMMSEAGLDQQPLDTRLAASQALRSFFACRPAGNEEEALLPALVALYDALNDDDEEVRDVAAEGVRSLIMGQKVVPLEAANRLLDWLTRHVGDTTSFKQLVLDRVVGHCRSRAADESDDWISAEDELASALEVDDSLFLVEKQNLWYDHLREAKRWLAVLGDLSWEEDELDRLDAWLTAGVVHLSRPVRQEEGEDGPLGWASIPHVFSLCSRLILGSVALARLRPSPALSEAVRKTREVLRSRAVSRLLTDAWDDLVF